ncbi:MAG: transcriptional regulator, GntR family [Sphingomonas bacterium]|nr:transcriptional regulator, GntR family [Sphingomonas bacterium]
MTVEERIRSEIEARIHSGEWRPGDRVPFEHELVITFGCSRATVSKALTSLARSGLIVRRRKAGSFVAQPQVHSAVLEVPDLAEIVAARGETYRWMLTTRRPADGTWATDIALPALYVEGIHFSGGEPLALERRLISLGAVPEAAEAPLGEMAPGTWLLHHVPWTTARHRIRAIEASRSEAAALARRPRTACLELERTTWRVGEAVTHVRQLFSGDRYDLVADFNVSGNPSRRR